MRRPLVVIPLFLLVLAAMVLPFAWPSKSADELFAAAEPLLASENPDDWEVAVEQYLDPLARKYPGRYAEEIAEARTKVRDRRELKRSLTEGAKVELSSDAERAYLRGLRLAQAGDPHAARREWEALVAGFGPVASQTRQTRWVELAKAGLVALDRPENRGNRAPPDRAALEAALAHAKTLDAAGKAAVLRALEELARDDPAALELIRTARK